jgi:hypothetical protein
MTLEWIGDAILLLVVLPVVVFLLRGVLNAVLLTTQGQVAKTIGTAADYGGSLDVILDDA